MIDGRERAEALRQPFNFDHLLSHKKESGKQENRNKVEGVAPNALSRAQDIGLGTSRSTFLRSCFPNWFLHFTFGK